MAASKTSHKKRASTKTGKKTGQPKPTSSRARGERQRTPYQLERQERTYEMHVLGIPSRRITLEMRRMVGTTGALLYPTYDRCTCLDDIRYERERRQSELGDDLEKERADSIAFYQQVKRKAIAAGPRSLRDATDAQRAIDKIKGVDQPTKIDLGFAELLKAIEIPIPDNL